MISENKVNNRIDTLMELRANEQISITQIVKRLYDNGVCINE